MHGNAQLDLQSLMADWLCLQDACAESFYQLHLQHPSAWTQEMELRPMKETW